MKKSFTLLFVLFLLPLTVHLQSETIESQYIQWTGDDEIANALVTLGTGHMMNIEREKAYTYLDAAVDRDPSLFGPHVILNWLSSGDKKSYHKVQAQKLVAGKNEVSRLFVSLLDVPNGKEGAVQARDIWSKMHKVGHNGRFIHFYYAMSRENPQETIAALEELVTKNEKDERSTGYAHNILGYNYHQIGNVEKAKMHFKKYIEVYPEGYNSYDSMAEFYLKEGKLEKALTYYKKAKEKFPASHSATNQIRKVKAMMNEQGNLVQITTLKIVPEHMAEYTEWIKKYKAVADRTNFEDFYVSSSEGEFHFASIAGKTLGEVEESDKKWQKWMSDNPELTEDFEAHKHTVSSMVQSLWRHDPQHSYAPEGYSSTGQDGYVRAYMGHVKFGHEEAIARLMTEFKDTWSEAGVSYPFNVYWNVYGEEGPCVVYHTAYKDPADWSAEQKEVEQKVGQAKLADLLTRWNSHMRDWEELERFPRPELSHINAEVLASSND